MGYSCHKLNLTVEWIFDAQFFIPFFPFLVCALAVEVFAFLGVDRTLVFMFTQHLKVRRCLCTVQCHFFSFLLSSGVLLLLPVFWSCSFYDRGAGVAPCNNRRRRRRPQLWVMLVLVPTWTHRWDESLSGFSLSPSPSLVPRAIIIITTTTATAKEKNFNCAPKSSLLLIAVTTFNAW